MNIWVEYWKQKDFRSHTTGSHAQMKEQAKWVEPDPKDIIRRYFDKSEDATEFSKKMNNKGYHAIIKRDGGGY
jgi:hypothetical protein